MMLKTSLKLVDTITFRKAKKKDNFSITKLPVHASADLS
uniref:Uncharacterized protein n=1 Tax=Lepeophtheirus salmonis TaxID=72036 RepID=A0A0K2T3Q6_LEPSM